MDRIRGTLALPAAALAAAFAACILTLSAPARAQGELKRALVDDAEFTVHFRTYYLGRDKPDPATDLGAWAAGGWLGYKTGWLGNVARIGLTGYTSQRLWGPDDKDGTLLLKPGQKGYSVVGEAYLNLKFWDQIFTGYRQSINQPEVNPQDNRMTPNTFEAYSLAGKISTVDYFASYVDRIKTRNFDKFRNMADVAGAPAGTSEAMWLGGLNYKPDPSLALRLSSYYVPNILGSTYMDAAWNHKLSQHSELRLGGQYMYQSSAGDNLLTGSSFSTWAGGLKTEWQTGPAVWSLMYTQAGRGQNYRSPYGSWAGYTSMIVEDFNRANERAWLVGASYDFAKHGLPGLSGFVNFVFGHGAIDAATRAGISDKTEYDGTVDYRFSDKGWPEGLRPLWIRLRYARIDEKLGGATGRTQDYRAIVNYEWVFK